MTVFAVMIPAEVSSHISVNDRSFTVRVNVQKAMNSYYRSVVPKLGKQSEGNQARQKNLHEYHAKSRKASVGKWSVHLWVWERGFHMVPRSDLWVERTNLVCCRIGKWLYCAVTYWPLENYWLTPTQQWGEKRKFQLIVGHPQHPKTLLWTPKHP